MTERTRTNNQIKEINALINVQFLLYSFIIVLFQFFQLQMDSFLNYVAYKR